MINGDSVNKLFTTNGEDVWRCISFCEHPTATMENLDTGQKIGGATHSLNLKNFQLLTINNPK